MIALQSTITCPTCGHTAEESMPVDACLVRYYCKGCAHEMRPMTGDCCVFCSYGTVACPPIQEERAGLSGAASRCCGAVALPVDGSA
jgi:hypothetical protein